MSKTYQLIDQHAIAEQGVTADHFCEITHERDISTGDVLTNVPEREELFGVTHCFVNAQSNVVRLVVAPVKFGRVSNIAGPGGQQSIIAP